MEPYKKTRLQNGDLGNWVGRVPPPRSLRETLTQSPERKQSSLGLMIVVSFLIGICLAGIIVI